MTCSICLAEKPNVEGLHNDCVIECLEKIRTHYISFKKQIYDKDLMITTLKATNCKLEKAIENYERIEKSCKKKRRMTCSEDNGTDLPGSEMFENTVADKSVDDLNVAMNSEKEFEVSFVSNTPVRSLEKPIAVKREPMKSIASQLNNDHSKNIASPSRPVKSEKENRKDVIIGNMEVKKTPSWISKENERKRSVGYFHRSHRHVKRDKPPNLSLKSGKLRQTRLQLDISKDMSNAADSTFCEEAIAASPNSDSTLKKGNSSRQWLLRNNSNKIDKPDNESIFDISSPCPKNLTTEKLKSPEVLDTSSVVMLTPATQDIIFLDDSCESFNIKSMDLLRDLMNPSETHLINLRRMESNGIKLLQKTGERTEYHANICSDIEKQNLESIYKTENGHAKSTNVEEKDLNMECFKDTFTEESSDQVNSILKPKKEIKIPPLKVSKDEDEEFVRREQLLKVDCIDCQRYIKYLGAHLTDKEVEQHIRNCSKHKKHIDINPTPDGFWDPFIKPLDKNDPRNETLIDDRFIGKEMHK